MVDVTAPRGELPAYRLRRVVQYIQDNVERELPLAELSAVVHMSPYRFVVRHRIDQAQALLADQTVPIVVIARLVGFRTASHFTTTFRRFTGVTPSAYRSSAIDRGSSDAPALH
jgi:AraC family transcriptional regulator